MADKKPPGESKPIDEEGGLQIAIPEHLDPLSSGKALWLSTMPTLPLDRARLINFLGGVLPKLSTVVNKTILVCDIGRQDVTITDSETGEVTEDVRTILFTPDGAAFGCVSGGVSRSLALIFAVWGKPPWRPPLPLTVKSLDVAANRRMYQLEIDLEGLRKGK